MLTLFESKPHIIVIFHLKTNRQKLEKHHVNGSQTRWEFHQKGAKGIANSEDPDQTAPRGAV